MLFRRLFGLGLRLQQVVGQHLPQHQVRVGAAESESGHPGDGMTAVAGPVGDGIGHLEVHAVEVDIGVGAGVVDRRRDPVVVQRQRHLGQARRSGRRLEMADIGFDRAEQCGLIGGTAAAHHPAERIGLDRITEDGPGAVRLNVIHGARVDSGIAVGATQDIGLGVGVGGEHAVGAAVVVDRATGDHREDLIAVPTGIGQPFENQHAATLGTGVTVGIGGERLDPAVRCQHPSDLVEAQRHRRGDQCVDPSGEHHIGLPGAQRLYTGVHRDQR